MNKSNDIFEKCLNKKNSFFLDILDLMNKYRNLPSLSGPPAPHMQYNNKTVIAWSFNDYLGLTTHPSNREIEIQLAQLAPVNMPMGSRLLTNNSSFNELETIFSKYIECEDSAVFATGYLAALGVIPALVGPGDIILLDAEGHSCLFDAAKIAMASGVKFRIFKHNDMNDLEESLKFARKDPNAGILIICDGVYSMKGDLAKLDEIVKLKLKYGARLLVDDAHGGGVMGASGKGVAHHFSVHKEVDLVMHIFSKAFGSIGGCISGPKSIIDYIRNNAKTYIFSHNMQLIFVKKTINSLILVQSEPQLLSNLWDITHYLQASLKDAGFDIGYTQSPITPVIFKLNGHQDFINLFNFICLLRNEYNIFVSVVTYPAVPSDIALIRLTPTALHSKGDVDLTVQAFINAKEELKSAISPVHFSTNSSLGISKPQGKIN